MLSRLVHYGPWKYLVFWHDNSFTEGGTSNKRINVPCCVIPHALHKITTQNNIILRFRKKVTHWLSEVNETMWIFFGGEHFMMYVLVVSFSYKPMTRWNHSFVLLPPLLIFCLFVPYLSRNRKYNKSNLTFDLDYLDTRMWTHHHQSFFFE